jgi:hypothetical protein
MRANDDDTNIMFLGTQLQTTTTTAIVTSRMLSQVLERQQWVILINLVKVYCAPTTSPLGQEIV